MNNLKSKFNTFLDINFKEEELVKLRNKDVTGQLLLNTIFKQFKDSINIKVKKDKWMPTGKNEESISNALKLQSTPVSITSGITKKWVGKKLVQLQIVNSY